MLSIPKEFNILAQLLTECSISNSFFNNKDKFSELQDFNPYFEGCSFKIIYFNFSYISLYNAGCLPAVLPINELYPYIFTSFIQADTVQRCTL